METGNVFRFVGAESIDSKAGAMAFAFKVATVYKDNKPIVDFDLAQRIYRHFVDNIDLPDIHGAALIETAKSLMAKCCNDEFKKGVGDDVKKETIN